MTNHEHIDIASWRNNGRREPDADRHSPEQCINILLFGFLSCSRLTQCSTIRHDGRPIPIHRCRWCCCCCCWLMYGSVPWFDATEPGPTKIEGSKQQKINRRTMHRGCRARHRWPTGRKIIALRKSGRRRTTQAVDEPRHIDDVTSLLY